MTLESGHAAQTTHLGADVWRLLLLLAERGRPVHLQWVPAHHCGVAGTECADTRAGGTTTTCYDENRNELKMLQT